MSDPKVDPTKRAKSPRESAFLTRKIATPDLLNPNGTLFGGIIMAWIDEVAFMSARRFSGRPFVVTANIDDITFLLPLKCGDHVILTSQVNHVGRTSMEIGVKVEREDPYTGDRVQATSAYLTFVALDKRNRPSPLPRLILETPDDHRRFEEALLRRKVRERVRAHLKRKVELNRKRGPKPPLLPLSEAKVQAQLPSLPVTDLAQLVKAGFEQVMNKAIPRIPKKVRNQISKLRSPKL